MERAHIFFCGKKPDQPNCISPDYRSNPVLQAGCFHFYPVMYFISSEKFNACDVLNTFRLFYLVIFLSNSESINLLLILSISRPKAGLTRIFMAMI